MFDGGNTLLQLFLLINVFVVGVVVAIAATHARAHFSHSPAQSKQPKREQPILPLDTRQRIISEAEEDYQKVLHRSSLELQRNLETTTTRLNDQLDKMGASIVDDEMKAYRNGLEDLRKETEQAVTSATNEIEKHQADLRTKLIDRQTVMEAKLSEQQAELEAKLAARTTELDTTFREREVQYEKQQALLDEQIALRKKEISEKQATLEAKLVQDIEAQRTQALADLDSKIGDSIATFLTETLGHEVDLGAQIPYLTSQLEAHKDELKKELES